MLKRKSLYESLKAARGGSSSSPSPSSSSSSSNSSKHDSGSIGGSQRVRGKSANSQQNSSGKVDQKDLKTNGARKRVKALNGSARKADEIAEEGLTNDEENEKDEEAMALSEDEEDSDDELSSSSSSSTTTTTSSSSSALLSASASDLSRYVNKQRVLIFASRGIRQQDRHLLSDLLDLLPHSKRENKLDTKQSLNVVVNELAELKSCNKVIYLENRKKMDLYLWMANVPNGPSIKFLVQNVHSMAEVKMTGNALKASRPFLLFDAAFDSTSAHLVLKAMIIQIFGTPKGHPKSKPFFDHIFSFFLVDNRIWFRNYQIIYNPPDKPKGSGPMLVEIGPRFVLQPIRIFAKSFGGASLWKNTNYQSPNVIRKFAKAEKAASYQNRVAQKAQTVQARNFAKNMPHSQIDQVFQQKEDDKEEEQDEEEEENETEEQQ